jgi:hypothetical protein
MRLRAPVATIAGAIALRLAIGVGFVNYDTLYSLVWGQQLARGQTPSYRGALAPTPHPLLELVGLVLAPLGVAATLTIVVALAYLALASLGYVVFRLGSDWFSWPVGLAAAALILSRYEVLSYGVRAYADIPYVTLVLTALALETRRPRCGWPVLATLDVAGLLRPEAWLFAGVYWLYLWRGSSPRERVRNAGLVALAPVLWGLSDLLITGNALWSLTNTRSTAKALHRTTGLANVPYTGGRRLGEVLDPDGVIAAVVGAALALWLTRRRAALGLAAGAVAIVALAIVASAGLPIQDRYVFLIAAIGAVFAGAALFGWRSLEPDHPRRRPWQAAAIVVALVIAAVSVLWQAPRFSKTFTSTKPADQSLQAQQHIANDLKALVKEHLLTTACLPISVPYATPIPLLALELHTSPAEIRVGAVTHGTYLAATTRAVYLEYQLDRNDAQRDVGVPSSFSLRAGNSSWDVYTRCR